MKTIAICGLFLVASCGGKDDDSKKDRKGRRDRDRDDDDDRGGLRKSKRSEASVQLHKIASKAKEEHAINGSFPIAKIPLTPGDTCCVENFQNKFKCGPKQALWSGDWTKLDFQMDEPHFYQYSYESDGKTFVAKAVGDLDCDTTMITYEVRGTSVAGKAEIEHIDPPPNTD